MEAIIEEANLLLKEGQWAQVIDLLEPLIASALWTEKRQCFQAIAVAHVMRYGAEGDWVRVLRLQEEEGSDADVKSQFRRLSLLIHPDQCSFHAASEAFVMLSEAQRHLMLKRRGGNIEERSRSTRQKRNEEETADDPSVDEVYSWWSEWTGGRRHVEESCSADYLAELSRLTVEKLRDRVFDLQRKILDQSDVTLEERKKRLRAARSMLSDSMLSSALR